VYSPPGTLKGEAKMRIVVEFEAVRSCELWGRKYRKGDVIAVEYIGPGPVEDWLDEHSGKGGAWGWAGYTSQDIGSAFRWIEDR
jgi:hypothetical protein